MGWSPLSTRSMAPATAPVSQYSPPGAFPSMWLAPSVPPPPRPPVSLEALVKWVESVPDLDVHWTTHEPRNGGSYAWSSAAQRGVILLSSALEAHPRECKTILAHEVGHHFTLRGRCGDARDRSLADARNECQACRIAARLLVPAGCQAPDLLDLCEECDVLPEAVTAAACAFGLGPSPDSCGKRRPRRRHR